MNRISNPLTKMVFALVFGFTVTHPCLSEPSNQAKAIKSNQNIPVLVAALPLTGNLSFLGSPGENALKIAEEDAQKSGFPLQVEFVDTKADPKEMATILRRELDVRNNQFFLVTLSGPSLIAKQSVEANEALILSVAIHPDIPSIDKSVIRFCLSATQEGTKLVERLAGSKSSLGLIVSHDAATTVQVEKVILPGLKRIGRKISWIEWFDVGQKDYKNTAARFQYKKVDEILMLGYGSDFSGILSALATTRKTGALKIIGGIGFIEFNSVPDGFRSNQFEFIAPAFSLGLGGKEAEDFRKKYKDNTGKEASYDAAFAYDAALTFARLYHNGNITPEAIAMTLRRHSINGVTGKIYWDESGEAITDMNWGSFNADGRIVPDINKPMN
jgi:ABC-type branched-subunit amino acid transport system substrate-binding protein